MDMNYSVIVFEKSFSDDVSKNAYLKACKWLANNLYNKVELSESLYVQIIKNNEEKSPTFVVKIFAKNSETKCKEDFCKKCRTINTVFYQVEKPNCDNCKANAFHKKMEKEIKTKRDFYKEAFNEKDNKQS